MQKNEVYLWYGHSSNLVGKMRREKNFDNSVAEILRKSMREGREIIVYHFTTKDCIDEKLMSSSHWAYKIYFDLMWLLVIIWVLHYIDF